MSKDSVCVVIPVHNMARYLFRCVSSVVWQLEPGDELYLIDDGSSDLDGFDGLAPFGDRVRWLRNPARLGISHSRNKAIRKTEAEWIRLLDADDIMAPFSLTAVRNPARPIPPEVQLVTGPSHRMRDGFYEDYVCCGEENLKALLRSNPILPSATFIRRRALESVGLFDERVLYEEDWDMWMRLQEKYGLQGFLIVHVPMCYYWYVKTEREQKQVNKLVDGIPVRDYFRQRYGADPE